MTTTRPPRTGSVSEQALLARIHRRIMRDLERLYTTDRHRTATSTPDLDLEAYGHQLGGPRPWESRQEDQTAR